MNSKAPAFQFYPQDYLSSARVAEMTLEEEGVYLRLLCYCWSSGSIPADPERCAKLAGKGCSIAVATNVQRAFNEHPTDPQRLIHDRLEKEREKQRVRREQTSKAGKKSAEARGKNQSKRRKNTSKERTLNGRSTNVEQKGNPSSSSSDEDDSVSIDESQVDQFANFWNTYPRRTAKGNARKAWTKAVKQATPEEIIAAAERYAKSVVGKDPEYIAHPATWLNGERWTDEPVEKVVKPRFPDSRTPEGRAELERIFLENLHT